jgi:hypothetical protein
MQRREFKDAMQEMSEHTVAKIQEHVQLLTRLDLEQNGELLKFGGVEMDINHPRTVLYAILKRLVIDFKPTNDTYKGVMNSVLKTLKVDESLKK